MFRRGHNPDVAALSALADGALPMPEARALEAHIAECDNCRAQLDGLRQVRSLLAAMPRAEAPRSFRLRQADVEAPSSAAAPARARPSIAPRLLPALSALGMIVFAVALGADITSNGGARSDGDGAGTLTMNAPLSSDAQEFDARTGAPVAGVAPPSAESATDTTGGAADEGTAGNDAATATDGAESMTKQADDATAAINAATADTPATREELAAAAAQDTRTDDGLGALFVIEIAALAVALGAGAVAVSMWARRRTTT